MHISFDKDQINVNLLKDKLKALGYPEKGTTAPIEVAKSYISGAVGKWS